MPANVGGLVALTKLVEHGCRLITKYRTHMDALIAAAVGSGAITSAQATTLTDWLNALSGVCAILKLVTKY